MTHDPGKQFVLLLWRDKKVQAQEIEEAEIARRFRDFEHLAMLLDWASTAVPGDSFPVQGERVLRFR